MLRRTKARLPSPSPAMAMSAIALFVSLGGVSYAAAKIGSAQIKDNSVASRDIKDRTIGSKDISRHTVATLNGQTGAKGAKGDPGSQGPKGNKGDQGVPGPVTGVLPSGVTERGVVVARGVPALASFDDPISFGLSLPAGVPAFYRPPGAAASAQCPGSAAEPSAAPGNFCLYASLEQNVHAQLSGFVDPVTTLSTATTQPYGVIYRATINVGGSPFWVYGTWAVTAP